MKTQTPLAQTTNRKTLAGQRSESRLQAVSTPDRLKAGHQTGIIHRVLRTACAARWLLLLLPAVVQADDYTWTTNNGAITIIKYTGPGGAITIPDVITGRPVASIRQYAFYGRTNLNTLTIGKSVTSIGRFAFCESGLNRVTIPDSVTNIGQAAFANCMNLTDITIPNSVTSIGDAAFNSCARLASITIPNSVTNIGQAAFANCMNLTDITIPNSVTSIGDAAFDSCARLASITIPDSVTNIGDMVFYGCTKLTSLTIGKNVTGIGDMACYGCTNLSNLIIGKRVTRIGICAFYCCASLTNAMIPDNVTSIGGYAFSGCLNLASVTIPDGVTSIGTYAFNNCRNLTEITIPAGVTSMGEGCFQHCTSLKEVYFIGHAPSLGSYAFTDASNSTVYYRAGTAGWGTAFGGRPTALWNTHIQTGEDSFGIQTTVTNRSQTYWRTPESSYADVFVEPFLPQFGYACEVGANDGVRESNTLLFENKGWTVLCIEPNPLLTEALSQNRKLWRAVACGSERADDMEFVICGTYPYDSSSGFHTGTGQYPCPNPRIVQVKVLPLRDVLEDVKFPRLDLLSIDVEGHELEVLKGMDFTKWHPKFVIVEDTHNADAIAKHLKSFGYKSVAHKKDDNIYELKMKQ